MSQPCFPHSLLVVFVGSWTLWNRLLTPGNWSPWPHAWWAECAQLGPEVGEALRPLGSCQRLESRQLFLFLLVHVGEGSGLRAEAGRILLLPAPQIFTHPVQP